MNQPTTRELEVKLDNLTEKVEDGFKGVHERQDRLNGEVNRNSKHRIRQEMNNKWLFGIIVLLVIPTVLLIIDMILSLTG